MSDFAQKKDETAADWVKRLAAVTTAGLSDYLLFVLGSWRLDAAGKAGAAPPAEAARPAESPATVHQTPGAAPLDAAKRVARALSAQDRARFTFWLTHGLAD